MYYSSINFLSLFRTDLTCIITLCKVNIFPIGKESEESALIFAK